MIQQRVIQAYEEEKARAKLPGYVPSYDDFDGEEGTPWLGSTPAPATATLAHPSTPRPVLSPHFRARRSRAARTRFSPRSRKPPIRMKGTGTSSGPEFSSEARSKPLSACSGRGEIGGFIACSVPDIAVGLYRRTCGVAAALGTRTAACQRNMPDSRPRRFRSSDDFRRFRVSTCRLGDRAGMRHDHNGSGDASLVGRFALSRCPLKPRSRLIIGTVLIVLGVLFLSRISIFFVDFAIGMAASLFLCGMGLRRASRSSVFLGGGIFILTMLVAGIPAMVGWGMILMGTEIGLIGSFAPPQSPLKSDSTALVAATLIALGILLSLAI